MTRQELCPRRWGFLWRTHCVAAADALGVDDTQAIRLFLLAHWPDRYRDAFQKSKTLKGRARIAANRIEHFIRTKGEE